MSNRLISVLKNPPKKLSQDPCYDGNLPVDYSAWEQQVLEAVANDDKLLAQVLNIDYAKGDENK